MKVCSIIVTFNGLRNNWIKRCLESLLTSTIKTEIIVIDNNSSDNTVKFIKEFFPSIHVIENKINLGFGQANNQGFKFGLNLACNYFFLLNQDATVYNDSIEKLIKTHINNLNYGILSPIHLNGNGTNLEFFFKSLINNSNTKDYINDLVLNKNKNCLYEINFINAACWLIPLNTLIQVGGFNPSFFHYGEDDNYCHRTRFKNLKIGLVTNAYITHDTDDRPKSIYETKLNIKKRKILAEYSNPLVQNDIHKLRFETRNKLIKSFILYNKYTFNYYKNLYQFINNNYKTINKNLSLSKENNKYIFL